MRKLILIVHTSLDGFVAGTKGELDGFDASQENLEFVCKITEEADAALFGRISYQLLNDFWPPAKDRPNATKGEIAYSSWYNNAKKIVISKTLAGEKLYNTEIITDDISNEIIRIKNQPGKGIMIFGSPSVSRIFMQHNLIDSYWIFVNPTIFGEGIPLFTTLPNKIKLKLVAAKQFVNGEFALNYVAEKTSESEQSPPPFIWQSQPSDV
ncbi:MAG TPA: dihydrofolate reductase family protein [Puia sp.]|jgi:dihydrofolate reductase